MNKLVTCLLLSVVLSSCGGRKFFSGPSKESMEVINPEFDYLSSKARIKFSNEKSKISATANFRIKKDSLIWISVSPALGIEVARVLINTEHVHVLDKLNKKYYLYDYEELSGQYDFEFDYKLIESLLLGNLINPYQNQKVHKTDRYFTYLSEKGDFTFHNFIGTNSMKLEKIQATDETSKNTISVNYVNFVMVENQLFPNMISAVIDYESEKPNTEIAIAYSKLVIEDRPVNFPFSVPGKYERN